MIRYHARWVVPVTSVPIANGTVACANGIIEYVGPREHAPPGEDYELGDAILLPGLINAHTHLELTVLRGFLENLPFPQWIDGVRRARADVLTDEMLLDSARLGILEGVQHGITTYADTCASSVVLQAMREIGVRGIMYQEVFGPDPAVCDTAMAELERRIDALRAQATDLVRIGVSPHAPYTASQPLYRAAVTFARAQQLPLAMHIAESAEEHDFVTRGAGPFAERLRARNIAVTPSGRSPVALLDALDAVTPETLLIHVVNADDEDIGTIVRRGASVAHCPASNAKLGHGVAPLAAFIGAGVHVGLGSDSVASNNRMDMLDEARLAALFQQAKGGPESPVTPQVALELATIRGARALGLADTVGSLEPGKAADLSAFPLDAPRATPCHDPVTTAIYALSGARALLVTVAGVPLVVDGALALDPGGLRHRIQQIAEALAAWRCPT